MLNPGPKPVPEPDPGQNPVPEPEYIAVPVQLRQKVAVPVPQYWTVMMLLCRYSGGYKY